MALRGGKCFLVRRFADRGISKNIGDSRVCGDRFNRDRRSAGRGNEIGNRHPQDIIKIERLRQRVRDLEEIRRLRQRVRDLELQRGRRVKETESGNIVWDFVNEEEEHPFDHPCPRFHEPIYQEYLSEDKPIFDEDGIACDEEDCLFVQTVVNGFTNKKNEPMEETDGNHPEVSSVGMFDFSYKNVFVNGCGSVIHGCGSPAVPIGLVMGKGTSDGSLETPSSILGCATIVNIEPNNSYCNWEYKIQKKDVCDNPIGISLFSDNTENKDGPDFMHVNNGQHHAMDANFKNVATSSQMDKYCGLLEHAKRIGEPCKIRLGVGLNTNGDDRYKLVVCSLMGKPWPNSKTLKEIVGRSPIIKFGSGTVRRRSNFQFDPGGTSSEPGEMTREVKIFRWFMILIINGIRFDVPFDPGGFGSKTKLEDEFFSKTGSIMQGYLQRLYYHLFEF